MGVCWYEISYYDREIIVMKKCKICSSDLLAIGTKLVCSNENCTYQEDGKKKSWFQRFAENKLIWDAIELGCIPSVIDLQYERLRNLLKSNELYGVQIKIKDIYEIEIKFLVLIILSDAFYDDKKKRLYAQHIYNLMKSNPSLGTWLELAKKLYELSEDITSPIYRILKSLIEYDIKEQIVAWRNSNIGHGFLMLDSELSFQDTLKEKVESLVNNFVNNLALYSQIRLCIKLKGDPIDVTDKNILVNRLEEVNELFILVDGKAFKLIPLIQCYKSSIYFFDSYIVKNAMTKYLASCNNDKYTLLEKKLTDMFSSVKTILNLGMVDDSVDGGLFIEGQVKRVDEIIAPSIFFRYDFINKYINQWLKNYDKGNFLIEMKAGMGKTTFVKMVDQLAYNNFQISENILCRAFYINSIYGYTKEYFVNSLTNSLLKTNSGEHITGDLPQINLDSESASHEFALKINTIFRYYKQKFNIKKLVIFIDGLDEIPYSISATIADIIPATNSLDDGIYLICTSRLISDDISTFTRNKVLNQLKFNEKLCVAPKTDVFNDYKANLFKSINKKYSISTDTANKLIELSNINALELQYIINLYKDLGSNIFDNIKESNNFIDFYWGSIRKLFGDGYYNELLCIMQLLVFIPVPISSKEIAELLGESHVTFKLLAFLNTLKHWITSIRTGKDTLLQITRPEVVDWVTNNTSNYTSILATCKNNLDFYIDKIIKKLDASELRVFTIELLAILQFDIHAFNHKYNSLLELYLVQLNIHMFSLGELDYSLHRSVFLKIDKYIKAKQISFDSKFEVGMYLDFGKILKNAGFLNEVSLYIGDFASRLNNDQIDASAGLVWNLYQLIAQSYDLQGDSQVATKYFELAKKLQKKHSKSTSLADDRNISLANEYSSLVIQLETAVSYKNHSNYEDAIKTLEGIVQQCKKIKSCTDSTLTSKFDELLANTYNVYGNLFKRRNPDKALLYFKLAEELIELCGGSDSSGVYARMLSLGQLYRVKHEYDLALKYYNKAWDYIELSKEHDKYIDPIDEANLYNSIANVYRDKNDFQEAIVYYTESIVLLESLACSSKPFDKTIYIMIVNNRRYMYYKLELFDLLEKDTEKIYENYDYINWEKLNQMSSGTQVFSSSLLNKLMKTKDSDEKYRIIFRLDRENCSTLFKYLNKQPIDYVINEIERMMIEDFPRLLFISALGIAYGKNKQIKKAIEFTLLLICLCQYSYNRIKLNYPRYRIYNSIDDLGRKVVSNYTEDGIGVYTYDKADELVKVQSINDPGIGRNICILLGNNIPLYLIELKRFSLALLFFELGQFALKHTVCGSQPAKPALFLTSWSSKEVNKQLYSYINSIIENQVINKNKAIKLFKLALKFYNNDVTDADTINYIESWRLIKSGFTLRKSSGLLQNNYIALELALRAMQYGSKEGQILAAKIYKDKKFDRRNIRVSIYIEQLNCQYYN